MLVGARPMIELLASGDLRWLHCRLVSPPNSTVRSGSGQPRVFYTRYKSPRREKPVQMSSPSRWSHHSTISSHPWYSRHLVTTHSKPLRMTRRGGWTTASAGAAVSSMETAATGMRWRCLRPSRSMTSARHALRGWYRCSGESEIRDCNCCQKLSPLSLHCCTWRGRGSRRH